MSDSKIFDFTERLQDREAGKLKETLQQVVNRNMEAAFLALAVQHSLSEAWAMDKAAIACEILSGVTEQREVAIRVNYPAELTEAQKASIHACIEGWAKEFTLDVATRVIGACAGGLLRLAEPPVE